MIDKVEASDPILYLNSIENLDSRVVSVVSVRPRTYRISQTVLCGQDDDAALRQRLGTIGPRRSGADVRGHEDREIRFSGARVSADEAEFPEWETVLPEPLDPLGFHPVEPYELALEVI